MTKKEYMEQLSKALEILDSNTAVDILEDYEAHFAQAKAEGRSEEEVIRELGPIDELVEELSGLSGVKQTKGTADVLKNQVNRALGAIGNVIDSIGTTLSDYEKTNETPEDYRKRQDHAKYVYPEKKEPVSENSEEAYSFESDGAGAHRNHINDAKEVEERYSYSGPGNNDRVQNEYEEPDYISDQKLTIPSSDGVQGVSVEAESADIEIYPSDDSEIHCEYENSGNAESKIDYYLERRIASGILYLNVRKRTDTQSHRGFGRTHLSILDNFFGAGSDPEIQVKLYVPVNLRSLTVHGKSGNIEVKGITIQTMQIKTASGDIEMTEVKGGKCMADTMSGDVTAFGGSYESLLLSTKSGDAKADNLVAEKMAIRTMSGDSKAKNVKSHEVEVTSMSGDAEAQDCQGGSMKLASVSGDVDASNIRMETLKLQNTSGDIDMENIEAGVMMTVTASGCQDISEVHGENVKLSSKSGDISARGTFGELSADALSGEIIIVQNGDTKAKVVTGSGDIHFHLKNQNHGFAAKLTTHGDSTFRYNKLNMQEAANGLHRYGAEGSSLELKSTSGDIVLAD